MARGVFLDVRHGTKCPAKDRDARRCRCAPSVRARVARRWVLTTKLDKGWVQADLEPIEEAALGAKLDHDSGQRVIGKRENPLLKDYGRRWLGELDRLVLAGEYSPDTVRSYWSAWNNHTVPALGDKPLKAITRQDVTELRNAMTKKGLTRAYIGQTVTTLSGMLNDAVSANLIDANVASVSRRRGRSLPPPRVGRRKEKIMSVDLARALLHSTRQDRQLYEQIMCGLTTGMRRMEISGLCLEQVDFAAKRIYVENQYSVYGDRLPKGAKEREVPLTGPMAEALMVRAEHITGGYLWVNPETGTPWSSFLMQKRLNAAWEAIAERPDRHSWHVLRHTFATQLDVAGIRAVVTDQIMGHGPRNVQRTYQHTAEDEFAKVVAVLEGLWAPADPAQERYETSRPDSGLPIGSP